jgi:hypothetical protein
MRIRNTAKRASGSLFRITRRVLQVLTVIVVTAVLIVVILLLLKVRLVLQGLACTRTMFMPCLRY